MITVEGTSSYVQYMLHSYIKTYDAHLRLITDQAGFSYYDPALDKGSGINLTKEDLLHSWLTFQLVKWQ